MIVCDLHLLLTNWGLDLVKNTPSSPLFHFVDK